MDKRHGLNPSVYTQVQYTAAVLLHVRIGLSNYYFICRIKIVQLGKQALFYLFFYVTLMLLMKSKSNVQPHPWSPYAHGRL